MRLLSFAAGGRGCWSLPPPDSYGTVKKKLHELFLELCGVINGFFHERNGEPILHSSHRSVITVRYLRRQTAQME